MQSEKSPLIEKVTRKLLHLIYRSDLSKAVSENDGKYDHPLNIVYRRPSISWNQKLLCVTHSERPIERKFSSLNYLEKRFSDAYRLPPTQKFESLWPSHHFAVYLGQVTIWGFRNGEFSKPRLLAHLQPNPDGYKPQHAIWYNQKLWILGFDGLDVYDEELNRVTVIRHPWLTGGHTIAPDQNGNLLVSCSGSDSIIVINEHNYEVVKTLRVPEAIYGFNYPLTEKHSTLDHYIDNDSQLTHINSAWPWKNGILVSNFIQGAIGWFAPNGQYEELVRGFVGCHGARIDGNTGQIYFSDSCVGVVVFLTPEYSIDYRVDANSVWLHDAQQLSDRIFALAISDRNRVEIMDFSSRKVIATIPGYKFGNTTQFVYYGQ